MDIEQRLELVMRPPAEEVVTTEELRHTFEINSSPRHYIGLEISGFLHLGSLISTGFKINDLAEAGARCTVFLADWHTVINDKMGGNWDIVLQVAKYYRRAFEVMCPRARIVLGSDLYKDSSTYWEELVRFSKHMSLARTKRAITIMGRTDTDSLDLAKLFYPSMQAVDIHTMDLDIVHAGMDQRKIHMLVREIFPKMGWKVPVAIHHSLLPGLASPDQQTKMSKSDSNSGIFIHDTDGQIKKKISRAWCPAGQTESNPVLEMCRHIIFHEKTHLAIERPHKFGGNITYYDHESLERDYADGKIHPADIKKAVGEELAGMVGPIRDAIDLDEELANTIRDSI